MTENCCGLLPEKFYRLWHRGLLAALEIERASP